MSLTEAILLADS